MRAEEVLARDGAVVPGLWNLEIRNLLLMAHRRGRIDRAELDLLLLKLPRLPVEIDLDVDMTAVMNLALRHRLMVYDATYLELAKRRLLPLATLDRRLIEAATVEDILRFS